MANSFSGEALIVIVTRTLLYTLPFSHLGPSVFWHPFLFLSSPIADSDSPGLLQSLVSFPGHDHFWILITPNGGTTLQVNTALSPFQSSFRRGQRHRSVVFLLRLVSLCSTTFSPEKYWGERRLCSGTANPVFLSSIFLREGAAVHRLDSCTGNREENFCS